MPNTHLLQERIRMLLDYYFDNLAENPSLEPHYLCIPKGQTPSPSNDNGLFQLTVQALHTGKFDPPPRAKSPYSILAPAIVAHVVKRYADSGVTRSLRTSPLTKYE